MDKQKFEVLAPRRYLAGKGPGSKERDGRRITSNSISAVIRLMANGKPLALFPGDLDDVGLNDILNHSEPCQSGILVFPPHGGRQAAASAKEFTEKLCNNVNPHIVEPLAKVRSRFCETRSFAISTLLIS